MAGSSTWSEDLVLAMAVEGGYKLGDAILLVAHFCERCLNVMCDAYKLGDGYAIGSEEEGKAGTSCDHCDDVTEFVTRLPSA